MDVLPSERAKFRKITPNLEDRKQQVAAGEVKELQFKSKLDRTAVRIANVYEAERRRIYNLLCASHQQQMPNKFVKDLGEIRDEKKRGKHDDGWVENVEDGVRDSGIATLWTNVAKRVLDAGLDPDDFVRRQFAAAFAADPLKPVVRPQHLQSTRAVENYRIMLQSNIVELEQAIKLQAQTCLSQVQFLCRQPGLKDKLDVEKAIKWVLLDNNAPLSALFRFIFATDMSKQIKTEDKEGFVQIAGAFRRDAAMQYIMDSEAYETAWKGRIPRGFKEEARNIYNRTHGVLTSEERK